MICSILNILYSNHKNLFVHKAVKNENNVERMETIQRWYKKSESFISRASSDCLMKATKNGYCQQFIDDLNHNLET